ncbi:MAG TPA: hypothetical protein VLJ84_05965 [Usitatibacter sp.]|nr:hypothetical protein [Usitatibacter sp.]
MKPRVLTTLAAACAFACAGAAAQWWNPDSPIAPGKWEAYSKSFVYSTAIFHDAENVVRQAVAAGDFRKLDRMHDEFLAMMQAGGNGSRMMGAIDDSLQDAFRPGDRPRYTAFFKAWREGAPASKMRPAAEARMWYALAWEARGGGYASDVPPESMKAFQDDIGRATAILREAGEGGKASPLWYNVAIGIAGVRGDDPRVLDAIFAEGVGRYPNYVGQYFARMNFLLPQWGGSWDRVDAFIREAVMRTQASEGTWLYANLYSSASATFHDGSFFSGTRASWPLMRHGFEDGLARGLGSLDTYATFACMARDRETTARILAKLGARANLGMGREGVTTEACQELVREGR